MGIYYRLITKAAKKPEERRVRQKEGGHWLVRCTQPRPITDKDLPP